MAPQYSVIIPARYHSTRLPGKPLLDIGGKPMIQRVYEQACLSGAERVVIATDDERIASAASRFGAVSLMTSPEHLSGTDRIEEVATQLGLGEDEIVVNVQGDEPLIPSVNIDQVAGLIDGDHMMATLSEPIAEAAELFDPNAVKVVCSDNQEALYFSRAPIPWLRDEFDDLEYAKTAALSFPFQRHIGIYSYRVSLLHKFVGWPAAALETAEALEQLRVLANGVRIAVAVAQESPPAGIDTPEDLARVRAIYDESTRG